MIVLDTNVLSELMRLEPQQEVVAWVDGQAPASLFTTTVTQAEVLYGVAVLPHGQRKQALSEAVRVLFDEDLRGRVLPFDSPAAVAFAQISSGRRRAGRPMSQLDAQIAAIARSRGAALATRNVRDFGGCGIRVVNPWSD